MNLRKPLALTVAVLLTATCANPAKSAERTLIHAGRLLDVLSGQMLRDQAVSMEDGRIVSVQP